MNADNNYLSVPTISLCPIEHMESVKTERLENTKIAEIDSSNDVIQRNYENERLDLSDYHDVLPLHWYTKKYVDDVYKFCGVCTTKLEINTSRYLCYQCQKMYHKNCVEFPLEIKHPYHLKHPLKVALLKKKLDCIDCLEPTGSLVYHCNLCNVSMHPNCAQKPIPLVIDQPSRHDHRLIFFTREDLLRCNVCSLVEKPYPTYVCFDCNFVAHKDCAYFPSVIRISRHHHRISFTSSVPSGIWFCGVCRTDVDSRYGAYTCKDCDGYFVHSRCALRKDVWDGKELENIPEEDDIKEVLDSFERLNGGKILHFSHDHILESKKSGEVYDDSKICHACVLPIYKGDFYSCMECDFILHDKCANAPRVKRHPLHPHPLTLKVKSEYNEKKYFWCDACDRPSSGFIYECNEQENCFKLDIRCGSISEPFDYQGHDHPLYLALDLEEKHLCHICQTDKRILINCMECDFIICLKCVNLPYMVKYKHDNHFLRLTHGKETDQPDWCEVCEKILASKEEDTRFYRCEQCCTTLHSKCLLGENVYMKPGHTITLGTKEFQILSNNSLSRSTCNHCLNRCVDKIFFKMQRKTYCSMYHFSYFKK